ncbi:ABC transporter substrate-binding protein [Parapedobacter lycopersici]|uniref:ABC transporter substrate-binding protein n=1 Tax=Parapedobacter lycopersici TaxID=1864939 RepID=UPI00214D735D|nr:ABC transporter substrate-binding protein [Parapedobacter lycopersici]
MMKMYYSLITLSVSLLFFTCQSGKRPETPTVGFVEAFEDATISQAYRGFVAALRDSGYSEDAGTLELIHRNAQGDASTLNQIISYFNSQALDLVGTSTTLATVAAIQRIHDVPVFQTVTAMPDILGLQGTDGLPPANLFGTGENLNYIDTSFAVITETIKPAGNQLTVGMIYNQSEPQSVDAYERLGKLAGQLGVRLVALPLNSSAEAQLVIRSLLSNNIDAFFANPDNTVFAAFEVILKNCSDKGVPVFTSEAGLVARGAVAAYGADIYQWGYQSGAQAATYLKSGSAADLKVDLVKTRKRVYNPEAAHTYGLTFTGFEAVPE